MQKTAPIRYTVERTYHTRTMNWVHIGFCWTRMYQADEVFPGTPPPTLNALSYYTPLASLPPPPRPTQGDAAPCRNEHIIIT